MCGLVLPLQWTPKKWEEQGQHISRSITHADSRQTWQTGLFLFSHSVPNWRKFLQWQISITHFKQTSKAFKYQHGACMSLYRASDTGRPHTWGRLSVSLFSPQSLFPPTFILQTCFCCQNQNEFSSDLNQGKRRRCQPLGEKKGYFPSGDCDWCCRAVLAYFFEVLSHKASAGKKNTSIIFILKCLTCTLHIS